MYLSSGHARCRLICFIKESDLEKCIITSLAHQWILCSEWVPSEWEFKSSSTPVAQLTSCEEKLRVCKKQIDH